MHECKYLRGSKTAPTCAVVLSRLNMGRQKSRPSPGLPVLQTHLLGVGTITPTGWTPWFGHSLMLLQTVWTPCFSSVALVSISLLLYYMSLLPVLFFWHLLWWHTLWGHTLWWRTLWWRTLGGRTLWGRTLWWRTLWGRTLWWRTLWGRTLVTYTLGTHTLVTYTLGTHFGDVHFEARHR